MTWPLQQQARRILGSAMRWLKRARLPAARASWAAWQTSIGRPAAIALAGGGALMLGLGIWWFLTARNAELQLAPAGSVDPMLVGTFEHDAVIDDYDWRFLYSIAGNGTCRLLISQVDIGSFQAADGVYQSTGARSGRVRGGTYRQVGEGAVEVTNASGAVVFHPRPSGVAMGQTPTAPVVWDATVTRGGMAWTLTIQSNPDSTYRYQASADDSSSCAFADQKWRSTSAVTGRSSQGTYRVVDARAIEIKGADGAVVWQRQSSGR